MTFFPVLMYYLWICLWFYDGKLVHPTSLEDIPPFLERMWTHIKNVSFVKLPLALNLNLNRRMLGPMLMLGRCTPATSYFSFFSQNSSPDTCKKASLYRL